MNAPLIVIIINYNFIINIFSKSTEIMNLAEIKVVFEPERNWLNAEIRKQGGRNLNPLKCERQAHCTFLKIMFKSRITFHFNFYEDSPYIFVKTQFSLALTIFHLIDTECKFHISVYLLFCWIRDEWNVTDIFFSSSIIINIVFFF